MNLLITGGAGYIGSIVVERAIEAGHRVTVLDTLAEGHASAVHPQARFVCADASDRVVLDHIFTTDEVEAVIHLAAETTIAVSMADPARYFRNNTLTTLALLEEMRSHDVRRFVFSSTAAVYGEPQRTPIDEGHPTIPVNAYGESKLMCERVIWWFCRAYGFAAVAFRYFNAGGASASRGEAHRHESHLIPIAFSAAIDARPFPLHGNDYATSDGTCIRDFVHVLDIADAHLQALASLGSAGFAAFNLGTGRGYSVLEVLDQVRRVSGLPISVDVLPRRPGDPSVLIAEGTAASRALHWQPQHSRLAEIVESAWRWRVAHPQGYVD